MSIEIKVPVLPESVADAIVSKWHKKIGDFVKRDENLLDLETDKIVLEVPAPADGVLEKIEFAEGSSVQTGQVLAFLKEGSAVPVEAKADASKPAAASSASDDLSPSLRRFATENNIDLSKVKATGEKGRITKEDLEAVLKGGAPAAKIAAAPAVASGNREEQRVPMTRLRQRIAERLLQASQTTAMLTTFNEVNLQAVNVVRNRYKDQFEKKHGTRLGYMSFFTHAAVQALKKFPDVNASIDGTDIVYHNYFDVGIAVSTERGLVVPVMRDVERMGFADIEKTIKGFADKARNNQITLEDMTGGTFTITNGGAFGSLLSTPILNPPQSAILGMHNIVERPIAEEGQVVIRPMMYIALSYDHRIIDGKQSVLFLKTIKEILESPGQLLLDL
jgi:2-oxoglutarate dehydrogenase E2 component (dihydrolipoamide succinyltransferase)